MNIIEMNKFLKFKGLTVLACIQILRSLDFNVYFGHTITAIIKPIYLEDVDNWFLKLVLYYFNEYI
jgi:hypothetical protein